MRLDWKLTSIIIVSLLCVVAVIVVALCNGHDGVMALTAISGFFGLAMFLSGKITEKRKTDVEKKKADMYFKTIRDKEDTDAVRE